MTTNKKYIWFIGTDVSKETLDHAVIQDNTLLFHRKTKNTVAAVLSFIEELKGLKSFTMQKTLFCLEHTGDYGNHLVATLHKSRAHFAVEPGAKIRNSMGIIRHNNDKVDAIRIAEYACQFSNKVTLWKPRRPVINQLAQLNAIRTRLIALLTALKMPLKEQRAFFKKADVEQNAALCFASIEAIESDLSKINARIAAVIEADEHLKRISAIMMSVPSIGLVTTVNIIICTNEFQTISNPKKFACYAGVAPFIRESGKFKGKAKVSQVANKRMKVLLHMCAITAKRSIPEIKSYYLRKTVGEGKHKMAVFNAIRYKLVLRVFACVNQDRMYQTAFER